MGIYIKNGSFVDHFTDAGFLRQRMPHLIPAFDAMEDQRARNQDLSTIIQNGNRVLGGAGEMKHVASIPADIGIPMRELDPDLFTNKEKFYKWLRTHPEYRAY